jgi:cysteine-rich repeat protein
MAMAINDALIASFASKYTYLTWRPETAIRQGDFDGNDRTVGDPLFATYVPTPCFPSYPSDHASGSNGGAEALRRAYGEGGHVITMSNPLVPSIAGITLHYGTFNEITNDIDDARVYGGIHYRYDQEAGNRLGRAVATYIHKNLLFGCGDGGVEGTEECDDGNTADGDGCSASCLVEAGYMCTGEPSVCSLIQTCGNGVLDGGETCDDGNTAGGDCCSPACALDSPGTPCGDDGRYCTGPERCDGAGACVSAGDPCVEGPECARTCNEAAGYCLAPRGTPCSDDGDSCTLDTCTGAGSCGHEPVGFVAVRETFNRGLSVDACAFDPVPGSVPRLFERARGALARAERASNKPQRAKRLLRKGAKLSKKAGGKVAKAATAKAAARRISPACAATLTDVIATVRSSMECLASHL